MAGPSILLLCASLLSLPLAAVAAVQDWKVPFGNNEHVQLVPVSRNSRVTNMASAVLLPDDDPFYKAPPGIAAAKPGAVLRTRRVPNAITFDNKRALNIKDAWQILYRTQSSLGHPEANVVTVLVPHKPKTGNHFSMGYFTDAASNKCNPSIMLQLGGPKDNTTPMVQTTLAVVAMSQGWIVSIPDSTGANASYACGPRMAYTTLDGMRAVLSTGNLTGLSPNPITTIYGYSGGASIASWVSEYQPTYAPEVKIDGVALGGIIPSLLRALKKGNKGERSKFIPPALWGVSKDYPDAAKWLEDNLIPERASEFREALNLCFDSGEKKYKNKDIGMYFKKGYDSIFNDPVMSGTIKKAGDMGKAAPKIPWYLYDTIWDDTPIAEIDAFVSERCRGGASILFERNDRLKLNHSMEALWGVTGAYQWLWERHNGQPVIPGCKTVSSSQQSKDGVSKGTLTRGLSTILTAAFGGKVSGP